MMILKKLFDKNVCNFIIVLVIVNFVEKCNGLCGDSFSRASAIVVINGVEENYVANRCVRGQPIESFKLLSNTKNIFPGTFSNLFRLRTIEMNDVDIYTVEPGFLENTPAIRIIKIERNKLEMIEKYTFNELRLSTLDLSSNTISRISESAFENSNFEYLCLSDNKLNHINPNWFQNTTILALSMTHNQVTTIDENTFTGIRGIKSLKLNYNKIQKIAYRTFSELDTLQIVYLSGNMLKNVDFEIKNKLVNIDVSFNRISSLYLGDSTNLWIMSIYPNPFECSCLREFWKFASRKHIKLWNSKSLIQPWKDEYPLCIVGSKRCTRTNQHFDDVKKEYFKIINYDELGQSRYIKENDFVDLGITN